MLHYATKHPSFYTLVWNNRGFGFGGSRLEARAGFSLLELCLLFLSGCKDSLGLEGCQQRNVVREHMCGQRKKEVRELRGLRMQP